MYYYSTPLLFTYIALYYKYRYNAVLQILILCYTTALYYYSTALQCNGIVLFFYELLQHKTTMHLYTTSTHTMLYHYVQKQGYTTMYYCSTILLCTNIALHYKHRNNAIPLCTKTLLYYYVLLQQNSTALLQHNTTIYQHRAIFLWTIIA